MKKHVPTIIAIALLILMAALMARPIREESPTMDEGTYLVAGYSYCLGFGAALDPGQPPLAEAISAAPLKFMDVKLSPDAKLLMTRRAVFHLARPWSWSKVWPPVEELFPSGRGSWYLWSSTEVQVSGDMLMYGGANDADKLLAAARWMQVALTVLTGVVIFLWLRRLANPTAAAFGVALWTLNPISLAYGHLVLTDMGVTLMILLAVWSFASFLDRPTAGRAVLCGLACGGALVMKYTAIVLMPILLVLGGVHAITRKEWRGFWKYLPVIAIAAAVVVLAIYAPFWRPAPPLPADQAAKIGVPVWFQMLRPVLIPPEFFKGLALQTLHVATGQDAFLCGQWRQTGWWYYFPVALAVKTPLPLLLLTLVGLLLWLAGLRRFSFQHAAPWLAASVYLLLAMAGGINIGVRYMLPVFALVAVGTASQIALRPRWMQLCAWLCAGWLLFVTCRAHPYFIEYFNEAAGGSANGYRWLVDSNLDWGQDVKRLKQYLDQHKIKNVYLQYLGRPGAIDYYGISATAVTADKAREIRSGILIVSASRLMRPEWDWLRTGYEPVGRVGYTLFVYHIHDTSS